MHFIQSVEVEGVGGVWKCNFILSFQTMLPAAKRPPPFLGNSFEMVSVWYTALTIYSYPLCVQHRKKETGTVILLSRMCTFSGV